MPLFVDTFSRTGVLGGSVSDSGHTYTQYGREALTNGSSAGPTTTAPLDQPSFNVAALTLPATGDVTHTFDLVVPGPNGSGSWWVTAGPIIRFEETKSALGFFFTVLPDATVYGYWGSGSAPGGTWTNFYTGGYVVPAVAVSSTWQGRTVSVTITDHVDSVSVVADGTTFHDHTPWTHFGFTYNSNFVKRGAGVVVPDARGQVGRIDNLTISGGVEPVITGGWVIGVPIGAPSGGSDGTVAGDKFHPVSDIAGTSDDYGHTWVKHFGRFMGTGGTAATIQDDPTVGAAWYSMDVPGILETGDVIFTAKVTALPNKAAWVPGFALRTKTAALGTSTTAGLVVDFLAYPDGLTIARVRAPNGNDPSSSGITINPQRTFPTSWCGRTVDIKVIDHGGKYLTVIGDGYTFLNNYKFSDSEVFYGVPRGRVGLFCENDQLSAGAAIADFRVTSGDVVPSGPTGWVVG